MNSSKVHSKAVAPINIMLIDANVSSANSFLSDAQVELDSQISPTSAQAIVNKLPNDRLASSISRFRMIQNV